MGPPPRDKSPRTLVRTLIVVSLTCLFCGMAYILITSFKIAVKEGEALQDSGEQHQLQQPQQQQQQQVQPSSDGLLEAAQAVNSQPDPAQTSPMHIVVMQANASVFSQSVEFARCVSLPCSHVRAACSIGMAQTQT